MLFFKGLITGFILSLPFGPMGIYCMEKTMSEGEKQGIASALGLITCDMIYGIIALLFLNKVGFFIEDYSLYFKVAVSIFLLIIGIQKLKSNLELHDTVDKHKTLVQDYMTTFGLAVMNITGILLIVGIYTALGIHEIEKPSLKIIIKLLGGIFTGGLGLWLTTIYLLSHWRKKITDRTITLISKMTGAIILAFGVFTLISIIVK
ncbi:MAG: LysE family translocator [Fusobacteriaceae bacterium]